MALSFQNTYAFVLVSSVTFHSMLIKWTMDTLARLKQSRKNLSFHMPSMVAVKSEFMWEKIKYYLYFLFEN